MVLFLCFDKKYAKANLFLSASASVVAEHVNSGSYNLLCSCFTSRLMTAAG